MKKRYIAAVLLALLLIGALTLGIYNSRHVRLNGKFYPKNQEVLDVRGDMLSVSQYEELKGLLPGTQILWELPFQGSRYPLDTAALTVAYLSDEDVQTLDYLPDLQEVDAWQCTDYPQLRELQKRHPGCTVSYGVELTGVQYPWDTQELTVENASVSELFQTLPLLPDMHDVELTGVLPTWEELETLVARFPEISFTWTVYLGGQALDCRTDSLSDLSLTDVQELLDGLSYLPQVQQVDLHNSGLTEADCLEAARQRPDICFLFDVTFGSQRVSNTVEELDISGLKIEDVARLEETLGYFPNLKKVIMSDCGVSDEEMDALDQRHPDIRFVWTVRISFMKVRTDQTWFAPVKYQAKVTGKDMEKLQYCRDMVCIDIGHMKTDNIDWAKNMPNLTYLIIGDTQVSDISPLEGHTRLKFLEMFKTRVTDYTPLLSCTGLEDLNIGYTRGDPEVIAQMTWLKNLWWSYIYFLNMADGTPAWKVIGDRLPDTRVRINYNSSTDGGWRNLPNYRAQRDYLGLPYMEG